MANRRHDHIVRVFVPVEIKHEGKRYQVVHNGYKKGKATATPYEITRSGLRRVRDMALGIYLVNRAFGPKERDEGSSPSSNQEGAEPADSTRLDADAGRPVNPGMAEAQGQDQNQGVESAAVQSVAGSDPAPLHTEEQ